MNEKNGRKEGREGGRKGKKETSGNVCLWKEHETSKSEDPIYATALHFLHVTSDPQFPLLSMGHDALFSGLL